MHAKDTMNKMKRQPSEWEKIFANEVRVYNRENTFSAINGAGKTGELNAK